MNIWAAAILIVYLLAVFRSLRIWVTTWREMYADIDLEMEDWVYYIPIHLKHLICGIMVVTMPFYDLFCYVRGDELWWGTDDDDDEDQEYSSGLSIQ